MSTDSPVTYDYTPTPVQARAHQTLVDELLFGGAAGGGKLLATDTPVLTNKGWTTHGELRPGDMVYTPQGTLTRVVASYTPPTPHHYLLTFSTGETIRAGAGHLWAVMTDKDRTRLTRATPAFKAARRATRPSRAVPNPSKGENHAKTLARINRERAAEARRHETEPNPWDYTRVIDTDTVAALHACERKALTIPSPAPLAGHEPWPAELDPWVMGMWLGDGSTKSDAITQGDEDRDELIHQMTLRGYHLRNIGNGKNYYFTRTSTGRSLNLELADVYGPCSTRQKSIPDWVYTTSLDDRMQVVQGIIDSDGHVNTRGQIELSLSDPHLFDDVVRLFASVGIRISQQKNKPAGYRDHDGQRRECKPRHRLKATTSLPVATYLRKRDRLAGPSESLVSRRTGIRLISIEQVPADVPANCITVEDERGLYLAGNTLIPTHNSRWGRAEAFRMAVLVPGSRTIIFRRTFGDLERSVVEPLKEEIPEDVATYNNTSRIWRFKNGSIIELSYLDKRDDVLRYQGAEYTLVIFEELTHFTEFQYTYMLSRLRAGGRVKARLEELGWRPRVVSTTNPGGPGHHFVKRRFVDPAPAGTPFRMPTTPDDPNPLVRCYIPARVADNPHVNADYRANLEALKGGLRKALLDGDWNVLDGVRFDQWRESIHVVAPEDLPAALRPENLWQYPRAIGVDYGLSAPFSAHWGARLPNGTVIVYRELYEAGLTPRQQAEKIAASEMPDERRPERPIPIVLDPSMWAKAPDQPLAPIKSDQPPAGSIARAYWDVFGGQVGKARNDRIGGWALIDDLLTVREDGLPRLLVLNTCRNLIRTLPSIPRDPKRPEDLDTHAEDHALDSVRYLCMELAGRRQDPPKTASDWYGAAKTSTVTGDLGRTAF